MMGHVTAHGIEHQACVYLVWRMLSTDHTMHMCTHHLSPHHTTHMCTNTVQPLEI